MVDSDGDAKLSMTEPASPLAHGPRGSRTGRRIPRVGVLVAVLALVVLSSFAGRGARSAQPVVPAAVMPVAAPADALSSSWFCAGPAAAPAHVTDGRLVIANAASRPLQGHVTTIASAGAATAQDVQVGATDKAVVPEKMPAGASYLGAIVQLNGGQGSVEQVVTGTAGTSSTPCVTTGASQWYFPAGTTQESATLSISLFNPYPDDAIADLSFTTEQGQENPQDFQGIVIPAGSIVGIDLGSHLRRRVSIATTVTLRVGRVAAFETQAVQAQSQAVAATAPPGTTPWPPGVSVLAGSPSAGTSWWWPGGAASDGAGEQFVVYNPGNAPAQLSVGVDLDQGSADPFQLRVDPHAVAVVASSAESRIPKGIGHAGWLRSTNGVGVVASRLVLTSTASGATSAPSGVTQSLGSRLEADRWLVPGDGATDAVDQLLAVYNPRSAPVTVAISSLDGSLTPLEGQGAVTIAPHHRYVYSATVPTRALVVTGPAPVVVEGDTSSAHGAGIAAAVGIPLAP
jgi:hypothetical protein